MWNNKKKWIGGMVFLFVFLLGGSFLPEKASAMSTVQCQARGGNCQDNCAAAGQVFLDARDPVCTRSFLSDQQCCVAAPTGPSCIPPNTCASSCDANLGLSPAPGFSCRSGFQCCTTTTIACNSVANHSCTTNCVATGGRVTAAFSCPTRQQCCSYPPAGGPNPQPPAGGPNPQPPAMVNIDFPNPLQFNSVEEVVNSLLAALRNIIVLLSIVFIVIGAIMYITSTGNESRMNTAKAAITASLIGLALGLAAPSFLKEIGGILGWGGVNAGEAAQALTLTQIATNVLNFLLSIVGILAIIMLVVGGIMYLAAAGDESRIETGKKIVTYSIIGIIVALASLVLVSQVANFFI